MDHAAAHPNLCVFDHPLIHEKLTRARDQQTPHHEFREILNEIAGLMTYEMTRELPIERVEVQTPLETAIGSRVARQLTLVPILRAGLGMTDGVLRLIPRARVAHIGVYRDEETLEPVAYYQKFPPTVAAGPVLLVDPMLATGGSAAHAVRLLKKQGCADIEMMCLVAAPEGVRRMGAEHPDVTIFAAALDRELNELGYILPGLGDAGDRIFGTQ